MIWQLFENRFFILDPICDTDQLIVSSPPITRESGTAVDGGGGRIDGWNEEEEDGVDGLLPVRDEAIEATAEKRSDTETIIHSPKSFRNLFKWSSFFGEHECYYFDQVRRKKYYIN